MGHYMIRGFHKPTGSNRNANIKAKNEMHALQIARRNGFERPEIKFNGEQQYDVRVKATGKPLYQGSPCVFRSHPFGWFVVCFAWLICLVTYIVGNDDARLSVPLFAAAIAIAPLIWFLRSISERITVFPDVITLRTGILNQHLNEIRPKDIRQILVSRGLVQRMFGVGNIGLATAGHGGIEMRINGIPNPLQAKRCIESVRG